MANEAWIVRSLFLLASYTCLQEKHGDTGYVRLFHAQKGPETLKHVLMFMHKPKVFPETKTHGLSPLCLRMDNINKTPLDNISTSVARRDPH